MRTRRGSWLLSTVLCFIAAGAAAQDRAAQHSVNVATGIMDFDLSGTGTAWVGAVRATRALTGHVAVEIGASIARPEQDFGDSTLLAPDAHLQYHWRLGRVRPFAGGGIGFAHVRANLVSNDTDLTWSAAGGARIDVTPRVAILAEMRVRGFEVDFVGSSAEWLAGVTWRLGS